MERTYFIIKANTIKDFIKGINGRKNTSSTLSPWLFFFLCSIRTVFPFTCPSKSPTLCSNMDALVMADSSLCTVVMNWSAKMALIIICVFSGRYPQAKLRELAMDSLLQTWRDVSASFQYIQLLFKVINWVKALLTIPANSCQTTTCTLTCDLPWLCLLGYDSTYYL